MSGIQGSRDQERHGFVGGRTVAEPIRIVAQHRRMLEATAQMAVLSGFHAMTVASICKVARVPRRTFYYHFADVAEAFVGAHDEADADVRAAIVDGGLGDASSPGDGIGRCVSALITFAVQHPTPAELWFVVGLSAGPDVAIRRARTIAWIAEQVECCGSEDMGPSGLATEIAVGGVVGLLGGAIRRGETDELRRSTSEIADAASHVLGLASAPRLD